MSTFSKDAGRTTVINDSKVTFLKRDDTGAYDNNPPSLVNENGTTLRAEAAGGGLIEVQVATPSVNEAATTKLYVDTAVAGAAGGWPTTTGTDTLGVAYEQAKVAAANGYLVLSPDGSAPIQATVSGATAATGQSRGLNATDWQRFRTALTQVASGAQSVVAGGGQNQAGADYTTVSGGQANQANATHCTVGGGYQNSAGDEANTISGGYQNNAFQPFSTVVGGRENNASGEGATAMGIRASTVRTGEFVHASGSFAAVGDCQYGRMILRGVTVGGGGPVELNSNTGFAPSSADDFFAVGTNEGQVFTITAIARSIGGTDSAWWEMRGGIIRDNAVTTTAIVGPAIPDVPVGATAGASAWRLQCVADTTNGRLSVRGDNAGYVNDIRWSVTIHATKVEI